MRRLKDYNEFLSNDKMDEGWQKWAAGALIGLLMLSAPKFSKGVNKGLVNKDNIELSDSKPSTTIRSIQELPNFKIIKSLVSLMDSIGETKPGGIEDMVRNDKYGFIDDETMFKLQRRTNYLINVLIIDGMCMLNGVDIGFGSNLTDVPELNESDPRATTEYVRKAYVAVTKLDPELQEIFKKYALFPSRKILLDIINSNDRFIQMNNDIVNLCHSRMY